MKSFFNSPSLCVCFCCWEFSKRGDILILTKGDANPDNDRTLYAPGQMWLRKRDLLGRIKGVLRKLGFVTIKLNDYPFLKFFSRFLFFFTHIYILYKKKK